MNVRPPPHSAPQADCAPEVEPRPASGSTDHLPAGRGIGEHPDAAQAPAGPPIDLLIVEDDRDSLMLLEALLRDDGFVIRTAASGHEGLACCQQRAPDLMLLDIGIPPPDGLAVLRELKADARLRQIPVLLLTGRGDPATKALAFRLGAHDYLTKPVEETELRARLTHHLSQARLNQGLIRCLAAYQARFGALDERALPMGADERAAGQVAQLWRARDLIERHLAAPLSPAKLATEVDLSQRALARGFATLFGTSIHGHLREARLQRARRLLLGTDLLVKTIALEVGYRQTGDLTRALVARFGATPTELREDAGRDGADDGD